MAEGQPVTQIITRRIKPGREADYERWVRDVIAAISLFPGYLGMNVLRPSPQQNRYVLILRFDSEEHLLLWEQSDVRRPLMLQLKDLTIGQDQRQIITGLEHWFTLPDAAQPPPRYKMTLVTWVVLFPLSFLASELTAPLFVGWTGALGLLRSALVTGALLMLMTYVVMPRVTRLFARWLFGRVERK